jgi:hypothetical protein
VYFWGLKKVADDATILRDDTTNNLKQIPNIPRRATAMHEQTFYPESCNQRRNKKLSFSCSHWSSSLLVFVIVLLWQVCFLAKFRNDIFSWYRALFFSWLLFCGSRQGAHVGRLPKRDPPVHARRTAPSLHDLFISFCISQPTVRWRVLHARPLLDFSCFVVDPIISLRPETYLQILFLHHLDENKSRVARPQRIP